MELYLLLELDHIHDRYSALDNVGRGIMQSRCAKRETGGNFAIGRRYGAEEQFFCLINHSASKVHESSWTGQAQSSKTWMVQEYAVRSCVAFLAAADYAMPTGMALRGGAII